MNSFFHSNCATSDSAAEREEAELRRIRRRDRLRTLRSLLNNKGKLRSLLLFKPAKLSDFLASLVRQQQHRLMAASDTLLKSFPVDVSIANDSRLWQLEQEPSDSTSSQQQQQQDLQKLPGIVNLLSVSWSQPTNKTAKKVSNNNSNNNINCIGSHNNSELLANSSTRYKVPCFLMKRSLFVLNVFI